MRRAKLLVFLGFACVSATGFCSPLWYFGFLPLGAGLIYGGLELVEVDDDKPASPPSK